MPELTFEAVADASMNQKKPDLNYGGSATMTHQVSYDVIGKIAWYRTIGNFDVSLLAGAKINGAKLVRELYSITNGGQDAIVRLVGVRANGAEFLIQEKPILSPSPSLPQGISFSWTPRADRIRWGTSPAPLPTRCTSRRLSSPSSLMSRKKTYARSP